MFVSVKTLTYWPANECYVITVAWKNKEEKSTSWGASQSHPQGYLQRLCVEVAYWLLPCRRFPLRSFSPEPHNKFCQLFIPVLPAAPDRSYLHSCSRQHTCYKQDRQNQRDGGFNNLRDQCSNKHKAKGYETCHERVTDDNASLTYTLTLLQQAQQALKKVLVFSNSFRYMVTENDISRCLIPAAECIEKGCSFFFTVKFFASISSRAGQDWHVAQVLQHLLNLLSLSEAAVKIIYKKCICKLRLQVLGQSDKFILF